MSNRERNLAVFDSEPGSHLYEHKIRLEKIKSELMKFGLTQNQAKVYIFLGKFGPKTVPEIFKALDLPRTETYYIINVLQNRGVVTSELSTPIRYTALPIEKTISILIEAEKEKINSLSKQKEEISELWNEVPASVIERTEGEKEKLQMLQGNPQIFTKITNMVNTAREEILILGSVKDLSRFYHSNIFDTLPNAIFNNRIIIAPAQTLPDFVEKIDRRRMKVMPTSKDDNQCFVLKDHKEILMFLRNATHPSNDVFAVWSDSRPLIDAMHTLFDYSWEEAEVCH
ncbi:MAG TPA: helix-turn-helix domain-containing protein [Candidatus Nitrosotalea sp.]|nr:helix-turn-helix domain-containing protein [Candidatus Nitrosotalea sp.]